MTDLERKRAFALRLQGNSWAEIGQALSYSESTVRQDMERCLRGTNRCVQTVYPALRSCIRRDFGGSVRAFARACGLPPRVLYAVLPGEKPMSADCAARIQAVTGLSEDQLRQKEA